MALYFCGATSDIGVGRELQEDFVQLCELDDNNLFCVIADGTGSMPQRPQPAAIVAMDIVENIKDTFEQQKDLLLSCPGFFIRKAMQDANRILGAFQMGNEELFSGYSASLTCCLFMENKRITIGHAGNTRFYLMRNAQLNLITHDHTKAFQLLSEGKIDKETYYVHDDRLKLTSGLGKIIDPKIEIFNGQMKDTDIVLMTTDGIHYALRPDAMTEIIFDYCPDTAVKAEAKKLIDEGKVVNSYYYKKDRSLMRWLMFRRNQHNYFEKYKRYFNNKGLRD